MASKQIVTKTTQVDIAILGSGLVGMAATIAMHALGLSTVVIDRAPKMAHATRAPAKKTVQQHSAESPAWDARVYAISPNNVAWLTQLGVWQYVDRARVSEVKAMQLMTDDAASPLMLLASDANQSALAVIVESNNLQNALLKRIETLEIDMQYETSCENLTVFDRHIAISTASEKLTAKKTATKRVENQKLEQVIESQLLLAADGANSWVRSTLSMDKHAKPYAHTAVVANFRVAMPHHGVASQWFTHDAAGENSILAWLPLPSIDDHHFVSIVWSVSDAYADCLLQMPDTEFCETVSAMGANTLGEMTLVTDRAKFPLSMQSTEIVSAHTILIGDAAHVIHPMAGQGVNLGFRDIIDLTTVLCNKQSMQTLYDPQLLKQYARKRKVDVRNMQLLTDGLFQLFAQQNVVMKKVRQWGFATTKLKRIKQLLLNLALAQ